MEGKEWIVEGKGWRMEGKEWIVEGKGWIVEGKGWRMEGKGWIVEGKGWRMEGKEWPVVETCIRVFRCCMEFVLNCRIFKIMKFVDINDGRWLGAIHLGWSA